MLPLFKAAKARGAAADTKHYSDQGLRLPKPGSTPQQKDKFRRVLIFLILLKTSGPAHRYKQYRGIGCITLTSILLPVFS